MELNEGRVTLNPAYCWVDVWAFQRVLGKADYELNNVGGGGAKQARSLMEKGLSLYQGPFLGTGEQIHRPFALRERMRGKYLKYTGELGRFLEETNEYEKAIEWYKKGFGVDNLSEEFCQRLMRCYKELGYKGEAMAVYNRFKKTLFGTLGIEPSCTTRILYESLLLK